MVAGEYLDQEYSASLDSNDSYASTDSCTAKAVIQPIGQSTTDPMITLNIMKSAVTNAIAQIQHEYSPQPACNQLLEAAPIIPVAQLRLDEDKRLEFLRVLNDFKRCLRPTSCTSSTMSVQDYSSLQRTVKAEVLPREANKHSE
ncbi:hypothetical protein P3T76_015069 [Phytophthora citrophthora]|uniref:Uncharacterized protein n=1 Tax=Phytophthora citrophthora TaxID=4793 RepID=A0AAD9FZ02_9STRA|nr:hypothetical protein P3T76_015689 [Phytophthora citrophthora]KAK1929501.1 hypothetical protein P3T76_015069 [Phytophthora citrophthora]